LYIKRKYYYIIIITALSLTLTNTHDDAKLIRKFGGKHVIKRTAPDRAVKSCQKTNPCKRPIHPGYNRLTLSYVEHLCCYLWQTLFKGVCQLM